MKIVMMMMIKFILYLFLVFFICFDSLIAQRFYFYDQELWTNLDLQLQLHKKWIIKINPEMRRDESMIEFKNVNCEFSLAHRWNKAFSTEASYRFFTNNRGDNHRVQIITGYETNFKRWNYGLKLAYFVESATFAREYRNDYPFNQIYRIRNIGSYQKKKWSFFYINECRLRDYKNNFGFSVMRNSINVDYRLKKYGTFGISNMIDTNFQSKYRSRYILVLAYSYRFNLKSFFKKSTKDY